MALRGERGPRGLLDRASKIEGTNIKGDNEKTV